MFKCVYIGNTINMMQTHPCVNYYTIKVEMYLVDPITGINIIESIRPYSNKNRAAH